MSHQLIKLGLKDTQATIDATGPMPVAVAHQNERLLTVLYAPRDTDNQEPHEQDEIYIVATGSATLEVEEEQQALSAGDAAFVAARAQHHFVDISDDFTVWAVFPVG